MWAQWLQLAATFLVGLPHALGNTVVCGSCAIWPLATERVPTVALSLAAVVSIAFSRFAVLCWTLAAVPLARDVLGDARRLLMARRGTTALPRARRAGEHYDARWWGRALLVVDALGTMAQYVFSRAAYLCPVMSARYLVGLYLCAPLTAAPLVTGLRAGWRWRAPLHPDGPDGASATCQRRLRDRRARHCHRAHCRRVAARLQRGE